MPYDRPKQQHTIEYTGPERRQRERDGKPPCPWCGSRGSRVIKTREAFRERPGYPGRDDKLLVAYRRGRRCDDCGKVFTTLEQTEMKPPPSDVAL